MSDAANSSDKTEGPPTKSTAVLLFTIAADTTWRMFVPVIGGTILGVWLDNSINSKPYATIASMAIGVGIAILLVRQQLNRKTTNDN